MSLKEPTLNHSYTLCDSIISYIDNDVIIYKSGNLLILYNIINKTQSYISFEEGYILDTYCVNYSNKYIICGISGNNSKIIIYQYPNINNMIYSFDTSELSFSHLSTCKNGTRLISISKLPNSKLIYWDLKKFNKLVETSLNIEDIQFLSFNPRSRKQFVIGNQKSLSIWTIDSKFDNYSFLKTDYFFDNEFPREILCHVWSADDRVFCGSPFGEILVTDPKTKILQVMNSDNIIDCPIYCMLLSKNHLIVAAESGFLYWFSVDNFDISYVKDTISKGIFAATFNPSYTSIIAADLAGSIYSITFAENNSVLSDDNRNNEKWVSLNQIYQLPISINIFTNEPISFGLDVSKQSNKFATFGSDGSLSLWDLTTSENLGTTYFQSPVTSISYCIDDILLAIGFENGAVGLLDIRSPQKTRLIYLERLHDKPVITVKFSLNGKVLASIGKDNRIYLLRIADFVLLGYKDINFDVCAIQWLMFSEQERIFLTSSYGQGCVLTAPYANYVPTPTFTFDDDLKCVNVDMGIAVSAISPDAQQEKLIFALCLDKKLKRYEWNPKGMVELKSQYDCHSKFGKCIALSPDNRLLASGGADGAIVIRRTDNMFALVKLFPHDYVTGGVNSLCFSHDSRFLLSSGADGGIFSWNLNIPVRRDSIFNTENVHSIIPASILSEIHTIEESELSSISFTQKIKEQKGLFLSNESKDKQSSLKNELHNLKDQFSKLLTANDNLPALEKLSREDFIIDEEDVARIRDEGDQLAAKVHEEIKYENLGKELVLQRIKNQCWDTMDVKGSQIACFKSSLLVPNFPIRSLTPQEKLMQDKVLFNRKIEIMELAAEKSLGYHIFEIGASLTNNIDYIVNVDKKLSDDPNRVFTSNDYLYHPADCVTVQRKSSQIIFLRIKIEELKKFFNAKFKQFVENKQSDIYRLEEKADRLEEIFAELKIEESVFRPQWTVDEIPEKIFLVEDSELKSEKVLNKEEREKLEKEEADKKERLRRQAEDDSRERALAEMMGGTLTSSKDQSLLQSELAKEDWMKTLSPNEMTEEQKIAFAEFEKKEKLFSQERDNRRKLLETECKKLKNEVNEICRLFDERVQTLFDERIESQKNIYMQELMISKLANELVEEEDREREEISLTRREKELQSEKNKATNSLAEFRKRLANYNKKYEQLLKEDKDFDRQVKKELADAIPELSELLFKFYKSKRTKKIVNSLPIANIGAALLANAALLKDSKSKRKTTIILTSKSINKPPGMKADEEDTKESDDLDDDQSDQKVLSVEFEFRLDENEKPEDVSLEVWHRISQLRGIKYDKELELKSILNTLEDMKAYEANLVAAEKALSDELISTVSTKVSIKDHRIYHHLNSEMFFMIKQGQFEVEESPVVTDLNNAIMIHRSIVEELNRSIVVLGTEKVTQLKDISRIRKSISQLKWTQQMLDIELEEYIDRTTDFQLLRVTKDLQELIKVGGVDEKQKSEIANLEKKIEFLLQVTEERLLDKQFKVDKIEKKVHHHEDENALLNETIAQLKHAVTERENIWKIRQKDEFGESNSQKKRVNAIIERRRLLDLAKAQQDEIQFFKSELAKSRQKTFPSFQQLLPLQINSSPDVYVKNIFNNSISNRSL